MTTGGGDFERALGHFLPLDVAQVRQRAGVRRFHRQGFAEHLRALEMIYQRNDRARRENAAGIGLVHPRPGRFRPAGLGADQPATARIGGHRRRQSARDRIDLTVERQLADDDEFVEVVLRHDAHDNEQPERDGQIIMTAFLGHVGRGEIDRDALGRQPEADGMERSANPFAAFSDRLVAKPDNGKDRRAAGHMDLHVDGPCLHPLKRNRLDPRDHAPAPSRRCAFTMPTGKALAKSSSQSRTK